MKKLLILGAVMALLAVLVVPMAAFADTTEVTGGYSAATIVVSDLANFGFGTFTYGQNVQGPKTGSVTVTNYSQSPTSWTVTAKNTDASTGYMRVGGAGGSPWLTTRLMIALDSNVWQWADNGDSWTSGPATGNFDFWARQDVTNSDAPGIYSIIITFTAILNF